MPKHEFKKNLLKSCIKIKKFENKTVYSHLCLVVLYITNIVCLTPKTIWLANFLCILDLQLVIYTMPNVNLREGGGGLNDDNCPPRGGVI